MIRFLLALLVLVTPFSFVSADAPRQDRVVILIGIDGFRPDYLDRGITPHLSALASGGISGPHPRRPSPPSSIGPLGCIYSVSELKTGRNPALIFAAVLKLAALPHDFACFLSSTRFDEQNYFDN